MAPLASAFVRIVADAKGVRPSVVATLGGAGTDSGKSFTKGFAGALGSIKNVVGTALAAGGVLAGVQFLKDSVGAASDLGESINAVNVTFGDAAAGILQLGRDAATAVGLSNVEFNGLAVQFSAFAKTVAGDGGDVVGTMRDLTTRAADFASVMNLDVAEAAELFQSGLAGETEPLRRFGIDLSAAAVEAHAYATGIAATGTELTEAQKVQARYSLLMQQTAQTQGDFANTSDSLANQQRILGARWQNLKATLGNALLPVITSVVSAMNKWLPTLIEIGQQVGTVVGPVLQRAADFVRGLFTSIQSGSGTTSAFTGALSTIGGVLASIWPTLRNIGQQIMAVLGPALQQIGGLIMNQVVPAFAEFLVAARPVIDFLIATFGGALIGALEGAVQVIKGVLNVIVGVLKVFTGLLTGDWRKAWNGVKQIVSGVWTAIKGAFQVFLNLGILRVARLVLNAVRGVFSTAWSGIRSLVSGALSAIRNTVSGALSAVRNTISGAWSAIRGATSSAWAAVRNVISNALSSARNAVSGALGAVRNAISGAWSSIRGATSGAWSTIRSTISTAMSNARQAAGQQIGNLVNLVRGIPNRVRSALGRIGSALYNAGRDLLRGMVNGVRSFAANLANSVKDAVSGAVDGALGFLGISSPSKVFDEIGRNTMAGFIRGILHGGRDVELAMQSALRPAVAGAIPDSSLITGRPDMGARGPVQITVQQVGRTDYETAVAVERRLNFRGL